MNFLQTNSSDLIPTHLIPFFNAVWVQCANPHHTIHDAPAGQLGSSFLLPTSSLVNIKLEPC